MPIKGNALKTSFQHLELSIFATEVPLWVIKILQQHVCVPFFNTERQFDLQITNLRKPHISQYLDRILLSVLALRKVILCTCQICKQMTRDGILVKFIVDKGSDIKYGRGGAKKLGGIYP